MKSTDAEPQPNLSRRYACDRCRDHKLRCNRDLMLLRSPCQRCRKARVKCTMGASVVRPVHAGLTQADLLSAEQSPSGGTSDPRHSIRSSRHRSGVDDPSDTDTGSTTEALHRSSPPSLDFSSFDTSHPVELSALTLSPNELSAPLPTLPTLPDQLESNACMPPDSPDLFGDSWWNPLELSAGRQLLNFPTAPIDGMDSAGSADETQQPTSTADGTTSGLVATLMSTDNVIARHLTGNDLPGKVGGVSSNTPSSHEELRENTMQEMIDLSASLMKDLNSIMACRTATSFLFTPSDKTVTGHMFKMLEGARKDGNAVGRMLSGTERFLNIIKSLNEIPCQSLSSLADSLHTTRCYVPRDVGSGNPDFSESNGAAGGTKGIPSRDEIGPEARIAERWARFQEYLGQVPDPTIATSEHSSSYKRSSPSSLVIARKPDVPSTLIILNCYVCLLKIHEAVFSMIHHVLKSSPNAASAADLLMVIRDLEIDGFLLENHRSLQIRILIQVSTYLLHALNEALTSTLAQPMFQSLLKAMIKEEGWPTVPEGEETGMEVVWKLFSQIQELLP